MGSRLEKQSNAIRKRIEQHTFDDEDGEEYEPSKFGGFPEYFRRKKIKLQNRDAARRGHSDKPPIFKGIVVHVNGYTQPSLNDIHDLVIDYGGGFIQYLDGKTMVTHIVASSLTPKKKIEFKKYRIVKPAWIVDSIAAGKLLPWENYRVVDEGVRQSLLGFQEGQIVSQANNARTGYREQTDTSWYTDQMKKVADKIDAKPDSAPVSSQFCAPPAFSNSAVEDNVDADGLSESASRQSPFKTQTNESFTFGSFDDSLPEAIEHAITAPIPLISPLEAAEEELVEAAAAADDDDDDDDDDTVIAAVAEQDDLCDDELFDRTIDEPEAERLLADEPVEQLNEPTAEVEHKPEDPTDEEGQNVIQLPGLPPNIVLKDDLSKITGRKLTAEEHNAILLGDPRIWKSSTVNPGFLKQYYEESRLHHLSTWKAELKSKLQAHARDLSASQQARRKRPPGARRYIFHVDFDSFFVAVSLLGKPDLVDKPCVVAHGDGSGSEIASCNYPAREFGVKNGMWMKTAMELCPNLKILPYDFKAYEAASREFYAAILETGGIVQSVSIDEALIDLSQVCTTIGGTTGTGRYEEGGYREEAKAQEIATDLRAKIKWKTGCDVSVGIGGNILLAKIALRKAKPAGQHLITPDAILDEIGGLDVQNLPGVAYSMGAKLEEIGIKLVKDIREVSKEKLVNTLGPKTGEKLWEYARGIDRAEVGDQVIRKSVSAEVNWGVRFVTQEQADEFVRALSEELEKRLRNEDVKGRQLTMKIMRKAKDSPLDPPKFLGHGKCDVFNKSVVLGVPTTDAKTISREALSIMKGYGFSPGELRGIGIQMTKLEPLKPVVPTVLGGQRPLQFKTAPKLEEQTKQQDADEIETPTKPAKFVKHPAAVLAGTEDEPKALLNTLGTQFVLPSQVDAAVLAELPQDIRSKLTRNDPKSRMDRSQPKLNFKSRPGSPVSAAQPPTNDIPSASQLDPEVLAALPEDLRAEILGYHQKSPHKIAKQSILPQSPHKDRMVKLANKTTPTKSKGSLLARTKGKLKDSNTTFKQANFAKIQELDKDRDSEAEVSHDEEISPEFLAALPEDIRQEILDQQRRDRLKRKGGLEMGVNKKKQKPSTTQPQRVIELAARPPKPEFTSMKLSSLPELRESISEWYHAFEDEEPNVEDVETLCTYLQRVVIEERDMSKAVGVVKWLLWTIDQDEAEKSAVIWAKAMSMITEAVQSSVKKRGLGPVSFE